MKSSDKKGVSNESKEKSEDEEQSLNINETKKVKNIQAAVANIELASKNLEKVIQRFEQSSNESITSLHKSLESVDKVIYVLNRIPEKIGESLNKLVPEISQAIYTQILYDFDNVMSERTRKLEDFDNRLNRMLIKLDSHNKKTFKKSLLKFLLNVGILVGVATSTTYCMFQKFPSKVIINDNNNIEIRESNVTVWGKGLKIIEKIKDKKS